MDNSRERIPIELAATPLLSADPVGVGCSADVVNDRLTLCVDGIVTERNAAAISASVFGSLNTRPSASDFIIKALMRLFSVYTS